MRSALVAVVVLLAGTANAQPRKIAVAVSSHVNLSLDEAYNLATRVGTVLADAAQLELIPAARVRSFLEGELVPPHCVGDPMCLQALGRQLGASELVVIAAARIGDRVQLESSWLEVGGESSSRGRIGFSLANADAVIRQEAGRLRPGTITTKVIVKESRPVNRGLWASAGATALVLGGAVTFTVLAFRTDGEIKDCIDRVGEGNATPDTRCGGAGGPLPSDTGDSISKLKDRRDTQALVADVLWASAAAGAVATAYFAIWGAPDSSPAEQPLTVSVSPHGAMASLRLSF